MIKLTRIHWHRGGRGDWVSPRVGNYSKPRVLKERSDANVFNVRVCMKGFTLVEIIVVIAISILFIALAIPSLRMFGQDADVKNTASEIVSALRLQQTRTVGSEGESQYGVFFDTVSSPHQYILFKGSTYISGGKVHILPSSSEISALDIGGNEVVFDRITGTTSQAGSVVVSKILDVSKNETVTISSSGAIERAIPSNPSDAERITDSRHIHVTYQGRTIDTGTEILSLVFASVTYDIDIALNMEAGQISWEGSVEVEGEDQVLKIHTHVLNDPDDPAHGTQFSIHRDRSQNTKAFYVLLSGDGTGSVIEYDADGQTIFDNHSVYVTEYVQQ